MIMAITTIIGIAIGCVAVRYWYQSRRDYLQWIAYERAKQRWSEMNTNNRKEEC